MFLWGGMGYCSVPWWESVFVAEDPSGGRRPYFFRRVNEDADAYGHFIDYLDEAETDSVKKKLRELKARKKATTTTTTTSPPRTSRCRGWPEPWRRCI